MCNGKAVHMVLDESMRDLPSVCGPFLCRTRTFSMLNGLGKFIRSKNPCSCSFFLTAPTYKRTRTNHNDTVLNVGIVSYFEFILKSFLKQLTIYKHTYILKRIIR